jgi:hypothetical protein
MDADLAAQLALVPGFDEGILLTQAGRLVEGEAALRRAVAAAPQIPDTRRALGINLLSQGRYREAWPLYDARIEMRWLADAVPRDFPFPRWQGEELAGKRVAVFPEQGWGDQIQCARFLPALTAMGASVTLLAAPPLSRLFAQNFPEIDVVAANGQVDFPDPDYWLTLMDLPGRLGATLEALPNARYLRAPGRWSGAPHGPTVGLMTRGNPAFPHDRYRSPPHDICEKLAQRLPATVLNLAPEISGARDFADTATIIDALDLVVSIDTAVAHLAGAMGKPCFLLIPGFATDWRWLRDRDDSPWYPGHHLYRSDPDQGWNATIDRLLADVAAAIEAQYGRSPAQG